MNEPIARRILVVYGYPQYQTKPQRVWPMDTLVAERLQMPLEWMGYEVEYLHAGKQEVKSLDPKRYAGIIFDRELDVPFAKERKVVTWALKHQKAGLKLLVVGNVPFDIEEERFRFFGGLGIRGESAGDLPEMIEVAHVDQNLMGYEIPVRPRKVAFSALMAPPKASRALSVRRPGSEDLMDLVFTADWGGMVLDPFLGMELSAESVRSFFDPFVLLERIWPSGTFPVPDPSTRDGLRIFYSHIDGDGFTTLTHAQRDTLCAEVVRDQFLAKYPLPVTVSVIEADVRAHEKNLKPEDSVHYEEVARSIFDLPNIQAASHSYSHPYVWFSEDHGYLGLYQTPALELHKNIGYEGIDLQREIAGSVDYISKQLLPKGKQVEMFLWSGNCRPSEKALKIVRGLGLENMNGGNTMITRRFPYMVGVGTRVQPNGSELQIHAANQNEYRYTNDWNGPYYGGFERLIETFKLTESPRRLKPVNVYYHFYSAARISSLNALRKIHQWCEAAPLHAMTTRAVAELTRDSYLSEVVRTGEKSWRLVNKGKLRTWRLPKSAGIPDMALSRGVTGFCVFKDWIFVHTSGQSSTDLTMAEALPKHLYLDTSTAEITFSKLEQDHAEFYVKDLRPVTVTLGSGDPHSTWLCHVNGREEALKIEANEKGIIRLFFPSEATVSIRKEST